MKKLTTTLTKTLGLLLLLMAVVSSCKKSVKEDPAPTATSNMAGKIDGKDIAITESALTTTYFASAGEPSSLMTSAALDASGTKMDFFIPDVTAGTYSITPKLGTSSNPGNTTLKINASTATTTQTYISYTSTGNVYYAISGSITLTIDDTHITVKWDISFKDGTGRVFTSAGSFTIYFYKAVTKPKTEVKDPTPVSAKPTIENIALTAGTAGDEVVITGTNFSTTLTDDAVKFNGVAATVKTATATRLTVTVPSSTTGVVTVKVANSETTTGPAFTYVLPPTFTALSPASGKAGDVVTLTGTNFSTVLTENVVAFNGAAATVKTATATTITVEVPATVTSGPVTLKVRSKDATLGAQFVPTFTVVIPANIQQMAPTNGKAGDVVVISGTNFSTTLTDNVVLFNGTPATVTAATATLLTVTVPAGVTTGLVTLKVKGTDATVYVNPLGGPAVNNFSVIVATGFGTPGQAYGLNSVYFEPAYKTYDNDGNLWLVDGNGQINKESYLGGDQLKTITPANITFAALSSYLCRGLARDANGGIHAYIYGSASNGQGNPTFVVSISTAGVVTKDFETQFYEKGSSGFAITPAGDVLMISSRYGNNDVLRLKTDGTNEIYLKGGTGVDNTLGGVNAYDMTVDGGALYVLTYVSGSPNTNAVIYKFDAGKNRTTVAALPGGGYLDAGLADAKFTGVSCFAVSGSNIYIGDNGNQRIRKLDTRTNTVTTFAGSGVTGTTYTGAALSVTLNATGGLMVDGSHSVVYNFGQFTHTITRIAY
ncbi:MAG: IPT/TIG domain-containing protein [Bacteroidota bacterium]